MIDSLIQNTKRSLDNKKYNHNINVNKKPKIHITNQVDKNLNKSIIITNPIEGKIFF